MKNDYSFIAVLDYADDGINITFPDLPGCYSCADKNNSEEALKNAKEALGVHLFAMEQDGEQIPKPSSINQIKLEKNQVIALIDVFMPTVRAAAKTSFVKKTLSLPAWLAALADEKNVNCSKLFQNALTDYVNIQSAGVQKY